MGWKDAKRIGEAWAEKNLPTDLRGQILQLVNFESDVHALFFYGDRTAEFHRMVTRAIARMARKRGGKTIYATITLDAYRTWLEGQGQKDSDAVRIEFIESCHFLSAAA